MKKFKKIALVVGIDPEKYVMEDFRLMKPECHRSYENGILKGSMLIQSVEKVRLTKKKNVTYFVPNNIALMLSISRKSLELAKKCHIEYLSNPEFEIDIEKIKTDKKDVMNEVSSIVCDYLENIQTAIVFGYTAIETFVNLSIPDEYVFTSEINNKGISENFDKKAIERWLPLKTKLALILKEIYDTKNVTTQRWWSTIIKLEEYRNEIIHQKTISHTEFYKLFFKKNIFDICKSPEKLIKFFHDSHADVNKTNPIWPWMEDGNTLPVNESYNSKSFEVIGNLQEGFHKKS